MKKVQDIRDEFVRLYKEQEFVIDKTGVKTVEIIGAHFLADEDNIFGAPNIDYISRELAWYESQSLNVHDIPGKVPEIWLNVATPEGMVNSNYGFLLYSESNHCQYECVVNELRVNPYSRRANAIYTRPSIWKEFNKDGMSDFICTNNVQYLVRNDSLVAHVSMRSSDAVYGYKNDVAWQKHVQAKMAADLGIVIGPLIWTASSLHIYERHFKFLAESE